MCRSVLLVFFYFSYRSKVTIKITENFFLFCCLKDDTQKGQLILGKRRCVAPCKGPATHKQPDLHGKFSVGKKKARGLFCFFFSSFLSFSLYSPLNDKFTSAQLAVVCLSVSSQFACAAHKHSSFALAGSLQNHFSAQQQPVTAAVIFVIVVVVFTPIFCAPGLIAAQHLRLYALTAVCITAAVVVLVVFHVFRAQQRAAVELRCALAKTVQSR